MQKNGAHAPQSAEGFPRRAVAEHFLPPRIGSGSVQLLSPNSLYFHTVFQHDAARLHDSPFTYQRPASVGEDVSRFVGMPYIRQKRARRYCNESLTASNRNSGPACTLSTLKYFASRRPYSLAASPRSMDPVSAQRCNHEGSREEGLRFSGA